jgi:hypothetical protein
MTTETDIQGTRRQIKDLTLREFDMVYSLMRVGDWADSEIARVYKLSEDDTRKVFDNYVEIREMLEKNRQLPQEPPPELTKKPRKRRSDARFATPAERQAAYRDRLQEKRHSAMQLPSPDPVTDPSAPVQEGLSVTTVDIP